MNEQYEKTLAWLTETCDQALTEAQSGNTTLLNRLGKNGSFAYYLNNVHTRKVMSPEQFAKQFESQLKDLNEVRLQYELVAEQPARDARLQAVEEGLTKLQSLMEKLLEAQTPAESAKPAKKGKKTDATEEAAEDEGEASKEE